jgi:hypothetical protein
MWKNCRLGAGNATVAYIVANAAIIRGLTASKLAAGFSDLEGPALQPYNNIFKTMSSCYYWTFSWLHHCILQSTSLFG